MVFFRVDAIRAPSLEARQDKAGNGSRSRPDSFEYRVFQLGGPGLA